jgi:hypothetical protein
MLSRKYVILLELKLLLHAIIKTIKLKLKNLLLSELLKITTIEIV